MTGKSITRFLAESSLEMTFEELPSEVVAKAKLCIYDVLSSVFGSWDLETSRAAVQLIKESGHTEGKSTIWVYTDKASIPDAAFVNTSLAHSLLLEDTHTVSQSHPGSIVIPSAFAVGEALRTSGPEILTAIVWGYEVLSWIGRMMANKEFNERGFRPSGVFGTFASSAVTGKLLKLPEDKCCMALGLAANCSAGLMEFARAGTRDFCFHNAFATHNGIISAFLARHGATSPEMIFEGQTGIGNGFSGRSFSLKDLLASKNENFEIMEVYFKRYPACGFVQTTAQAALRAREKYPIVVGDIHEIILKTNRLGKIWPGVDFSGPFRTITQAQMSNQFMLAVGLIDGVIDPQSIRKFSDRKYEELARKVRVEIDDECDRKFPEKWPTKLIIKMQDGNEFLVQEEDTDYPTDIYVRERFSKSASDLLTDSEIQELTDLIDNLEKHKDIATKFNALLGSRQGIS